MSNLPHFQDILRDFPSQPYEWKIPLTQKSDP